MKGVKRTVFILLIFGLLLLSEAITLLVTNADGLPGTEPKAKVGHSSDLPPFDVKVAGLDFYYRMDEKARFMELKNQWQSAHRGGLPTGQATEYSKEAYNQASVEEVLKQWRYHGGPNPWVFRAKGHLFNDGKKAYLNVPLRVTFRAKFGDLKVDPDTQMANFTHLQQTARWKTLPVSHAINIPAIAPGEDILLDLGQINLLALIYPNQTNTQPTWEPPESCHCWPVEMEVRLDSPRFSGATRTLRLIPDHFVLPTVY
jgi:hypothetical protein